MRIEVNLYASFRTDRFVKEVREYQEGCTLRQVLVDIGVSENMIGMSLANGRHVTLDQELSDGDALALFPMLAGG